MALNNINVLIPLGKLPAPFKAEGHLKPLPLISLLGRPVISWIIDRLKIIPGDVIWLVVSHKDELLHQINGTLSEMYSDLVQSGCLKLIETRFLTKGVLETLYVALQYMTDTDLKRRTLCINGDTIYDCSIPNSVRDMEACAARCFLAAFEEASVLKDYGNVDWYCCDTDASIASSSCTLDDLAPDCAILGVSKFLPTKAPQPDRLLMIGAHAFGSGFFLRDIITRLLFSKDMVVNFSCSFQDLVVYLIGHENRHYGGTIVRTSHFIPIKTPRQLQDVISKQEAHKVHPAQVGNFVFQLYGGLLCSEGHHRKHVVTAAKMLKSMGHQITISSNRGNSKLAVQMLMRELDDLGVDYDHLEFSSPLKSPTTVIGSNFVDVRKDIARELGLPKFSHYCEETVEARHFNQVIISEDYVLKSSDREALEGEAFYYESIPTQVSHLFPRLLSRSEADGRIALQLSRVHGRTFSQLLVNRCVSKSRLEGLLEGIRLLHSTDKPLSTRESEVDYYANYTAKVMRRAKSHRTLYEKLAGASSASDVIHKICSLLDEYRSVEAGQIRNFIHGDPVFTNCLLTADESVVYIDMNGKVGTTLTTRGDCAYDLAKILQSLYGYDYILLDVPIMEQDEVLLSSLRAHFYSYIEKHYPGMQSSHLRLITASLYLSLIPLHDNAVHQKKFWEKCLELSSLII